MKKFDVLIVGNGILGLSTAFALTVKDPSLSIAILGSRSRVGSASFASGAMLNVFGEVTSTTFKSKPGRKKFELSLKALRQWSFWLEGINSYLATNKQIKIAPETFVILNSKSGKLDTENYLAILKALEEYNEKYEEIKPDSISGLNPVEDCRPLRALRLPNEGSIHSVSLIEALENILINHFNVIFIDDLVQTIFFKSNHVVSVVLKNKDQLFANNIVLAAGTYCQKLIDQIPFFANRIPRLLSGVGSSLVLEQRKECLIHHVIRTPNRSGACGLHALPHGENRLYVGATNNIFFDTETQEAAGFQHFLLECAIEQLNEDFYKSRVLSWITGNRPATIDGFPLIGETSIKGLFLLTGTYREGFHQSPILAEFIADQVLEDKTPYENIFKPERSLIQTFTKEEGIEIATKHFMCGAYERGMKLPKIGWDNLIRDMFQKRLEDLYENLGINFGLSPDITLLFQFDPNPAERIAFFREYFAQQNPSPHSQAA